MSLDYFGQSSFKEKWNGLDLVYSCDKVILTGRFLFGAIDRMFSYMRQLSYQSCIGPLVPWGYALYDVRFYEKLSLMSYRNNFVIEFYNEEKEKVSFYFGIGFNANNGFQELWKLEFNPNKILTNCNAWMRDFLLLLKSCSRVGGLINSIEVKFFDLAIDFPVSRDCVLYDKENRLHKMYLLSALDRTDYYGVSHKHGATKVYNKGIEADLKRDLTRLEVTLELDDFNSVRKYFEALSVLQHGQMKMDDLGAKLTQNDKVVLELLNMHPEYLSRFNRWAKTKYEPYLKDFCQPFQLSLKAFNHVASWISYFTRMDIGGIFGDNGR